MTAQVSSQASHAETQQDAVLAQVRNHIGHLTLNRPAGLNAITLDMVRQLTAHLQAWADDPEVYAVVLRGAGEKAFAPAATSVRCTTASSKATPCTRTSSSRNMPSTWPSTTTVNPYWH